MLLYLEVKMQKRNIVLAVVLTFVTFGIYGLYWLYKMTNEMHELLGRQNTAAGGWVIFYSLITCGIYGFYWCYKMGEAVSEVTEKHGMRSRTNESLIYLLLSLFGLGIICSCLLQDRINDFVELENSML